MIKLGCLNPENDDVLSFFVVFFFFIHYSCVLVGHILYPGPVTTSKIMTTITNGFHVVVCLSNNRSQVMSKCGNKNKVALKVIAECVTVVLPTF